jgi:hypothetical protein
MDLALVLNASRLVIDRPQLGKDRHSLHAPRRNVELEGTDLSGLAGDRAQDGQSRAVIEQRGGDDESIMRAPHLMTDCRIPIHVNDMAELRHVALAGEVTDECHGRQVWTGAEEASEMNAPDIRASVPFQLR